MTHTNMSDEMIKAIVTTVGSLKEVATAFNITTSYVSQLRHEHHTEWFKAKRAARLELDKLICLDYDVGLSVSKLAIKYKLSYETIYKAIRANKMTYWGRARDEIGVFKWNGRKWIPAFKYELNDWLGSCPIRWVETE